MTPLASELGWLVKGLPAGGSLISVGCSLAYEADALAAAGFSVLGIDNDGPTIAAARARLASRPDGPTLLVRDALRFTPETAVEVVLLRRPNLVEQPAQWARILARTTSWLKPGGMLTLTTPGLAEARVAERLLTAAGYEPATRETGVAGEGFLLTASAPVPERTDRNSPAPDLPQLATPANLVILDLGDEPVHSCDPSTGLCS